MSKTIIGNGLDRVNAEESNAIETLDGAEWMGCSLKVSQARPREENHRGRRNDFN